MASLVIMPVRVHGAAPKRVDQRKGMPASSDAERAILGAIMAENDCLFEVASELMSNHFSLDSHRKIFGAMISVREEGKHIDAVTLADELSARGCLSNIGGVGYLSELEDGALTAKRNLPDHVRILKEKASLRQIISACEATIARAELQDEPANKIVSLCEVELHEILADTHGGGSEVKLIGDYGVEFFEDLAKIREYKAELIGLTYGLSNVDFTTTGMRPGETSVIGGRPGSGKSSFALGAAIRVAEEQVPVYYKSAEMRGGGLFSRTLSALTKVNNFHLRDPRQLSKDEENKIEIGADEAKLLPLWVDDRAGQHIAQVLATARLMVKKHGVKLCIFDYAQLINADGRDRQERVGNVAEGVAVFGREMNVHCMLLSQLTRADRKAKNAIPTMDDLKESGRLEENADVVILLHRGQGEREGEDYAIIAKQRNGPVGSEKVFFHRETLMYHPREDSK